jgi:hypothetical protein
MKISISGKMLRNFVIGSLYQYHRDTDMKIDKEDFDHFVNDTCNKLHKYLTGGFSTNGSWSDIQCSIAWNVVSLFGIHVHGPDKDEIEVRW